MKKLGLMMAATMAATLMGAAAQAEELMFTVDFGANDTGVVETFNVDTSQSGTPSAASARSYGAPHDFDFVITDDSAGNTVLQVGNSQDNFFFSTGVSDSDAFDSQATYTYGTTPFYDSHNNVLVAHAGEVTTGNDGTTITVSAVSAAPEPGVWALMLAGVAMIGLTLRQGRRQRALTLAA